MPPDNAKYLEELWIGIKADYTSLQAGLKISQNEIKSFVGHVAASSAQLKKFGRTTTIISGIVVAFGAVVNSVFAKFEQSMANTVSVIGGTKKDMKELGDFARKMGETTIFSASQSADAMYFLASAGFSANQVIGSLQATLQLAAATQFDLAETTRIVVSSLNAYQLKATDAIKVSNVFSAIISSSQATMSRLGESLKYVAPIASQLGISIEQTSAALGELFNSGLQASQAGTSLRQGLIRLQAPTKAATEAIKKLGIHYDDINPQMHSLVEIMDAFNKAGAGMIDKGDELAKIFGSRTVAAWQILIKNGAKSMADLEEKITGTNKAAEMAEIQLNTFSGQWKILKSVMQEAAIQMGEALQPILRSLVEIFQDAFALFNHLPKSIKTITVAALALAAGLGLVVGPVALLVAQLPALIAMVSTLGVSFGVALGWVGLLSAAIIAITAAIGGYIRKKAELSATTMKIIDTTREQQGEFDLLSKRYLQLKKTVNKTKNEKILYLKTIKELQEKYPNYLKNIDLEKVGYQEASIAIETANKSLKKYLETQVAQAVLSDANSKYIEIGKKIAAVTETLTDLQIAYNEELNNTNSILSPEQIKTKYETLISFSKILLNKLKKDQIEAFKDVQQQTAAILKNFEIPPPKNDQNKPSGVGSCPNGYHWDFGKQKCLPNKIENIPGNKTQSPSNEIINTFQQQKQQLDSFIENKLRFQIDQAKQQAQLNGGSGFSEQYGAELETYQKFLQDKLSSAQEWSDEYVNILQELQSVKLDLYDNELGQARFMFLSIEDIANSITAAIANGWNQMWNTYIMPRSRKAKNELDGIWMAIENSFLRALQQILQNWITKQVLNLILKLAGFALGGAPAAVATVGSNLLSSGNDSTYGAGLLPAGAMGASVEKSGKMTVHAGEIIVPANIVRQNRKNYENAIGNKSDNSNSGISNNISIILNNPSIDNDSYWDSVLEEHINPAIDRIKKRMS